MNALVDDLAQAIMRGINSAAAVTPINLLATVLLATPRGALPETRDCCASSTCTSRCCAPSPTARA